MTLLTYVRLKVLLPLHGVGLGGAAPLEEVGGSVARGPNPTPETAALVQ